jgi:hypothetical protein
MKDHPQELAPGIAGGLSVAEVHAGGMLWLAASAGKGGL